MKVWLHGLLAPANTEVVIQAKLRVSRLEEKEVKSELQSELGARYEQNGSKVEGWVDDSWQCLRKA